MTYRSVGGILMPFAEPPPPPHNWIAGVTPELEAEAERLWKADAPGGWMVSFSGQPRDVRLKYLKLAGLQC